MKRKVLILTDTYFQLIVAIQLKRTVYSSDEVDIIVTDHSNGCEAVSQRLNAEHLFRSVYYVHDDNDAGESVSDKVKRYLFARTAPRRALCRYAFLPDRYDVVLFSNASMLAHLICFCNKQADCYRMEEGYSTYTRPLLVKRPMRRVLIRAAFGDLRKRLKGLYLFHPDLFQQPAVCPLLPIPPLNKQDEEFRQILNRIFQCNAKHEPYDADFIFLEESFRANGALVDDLTLIQTIADIVGPERLMVKKHPRNKDELSLRNGVRVNRTAGIPWEVVLMNEDFSGKTVLTITSSAALASALFPFEPTVIILLYNCIETKSPMLDDGYRAFISALQKTQKNIIIPAGIEELPELLSGRTEE